MPRPKDIQILKRHLQKKFRQSYGKSMPPEQLRLAAEKISGGLKKISVDEWIMGHRDWKKQKEDFAIKPFLREVDI